MEYLPSFLSLRNNYKEKLSEKFPTFSDNLVNELENKIYEYVKEDKRHYMIFDIRCIIYYSAIMDMVIKEEKRKEEAFFVEDGSIKNYLHSKCIEKFPDFESKQVLEESKNILEFEESKSETEGAFACPNCKGKNTSYYELQTRSSDEPMTIFASCNDCGKKFRK